MSTILAQSNLNDTQNYNLQLNSVFACYFAGTLSLYHQNTNHLKCCRFGVARKC